MQATSSCRRSGFQPPRSLTVTLIFAGLIAGLFTPVFAADPQQVYVGTVVSEFVVGFPAVVLVFDAETKSVLSTWHVPDYSSESIHELAVAPDGAMLYVPINGPFAHLVRFMQPNGTESGPSCTVGLGPIGVALTPDGSQLYVANYGANTVSVIGAADHQLLATIPVGHAPTDIVVAPDGASAYVTVRDDDAVQVISTSTRQVTATISVGDAPFGVAITPAGSKLFVAESGSGHVSVIDTASGAVMDSVTVGGGPHWIAVTPDGKTAWVSNSASGTVSVINTASRAVIQTVTVGNTPEGLAAMPNGSEVWVVNSSPAGGSSISVVDTASFAVVNVPLPADFFGDRVGYSIVVTDTTAKIAGRVTATGGGPVSGAQIRARQSGTVKGEATTDASGDYSVANLQAGTYDVEVTASGFPSSTRSLTLTVGQTRIANFELAQSSCVSSLSPSTAGFHPDGGTGQLQVTAPAGCSWGATSGADWIAITSGSSGTGNGTIHYSVGVNAGAGTRTGTVNVGSRSLTVTQEACPGITISPEALAQAPLGGPYKATLSASGGVAPYTYSVTGGQLPAGFTLSSAGVLSGTATNTGDYYFTVTVGAAYGCTGTRDYLLKVVGTAVATWLSVPSGVTDELRAVDFVDQLIGWVAGPTAALLRTTNGGATWSKVSFTTFSDKLHSVKFLDQNVGWAGGIREIVRTKDGGNTWFTITFSDTDIRCYSWYPISTDMIFGAGNVNSSPGYYHWRVKLNADNSVNSTSWAEYTNRIMRGISFGTADTGGSVGEQGRIVRISNASGDSVGFAVQSSGTQESLNAIKMLDAQKGWIVGAKGTILRTTNGGATWTPLNSGTSIDLYGVHFVDAMNGWVVGDGGLILATSNGGDTWVQESCQVTNSLRGVTFKGTGYAVGVQGAIVKRTACEYSISPASAAVGMEGGTGVVVVTGTGGCTWVALSQDPWITVTSAGAGTGAGAVSFLVAPNGGPARTGTLTVAGKTVTIVQAASTGLLVFPQYANGAVGQVLNRTRIVLQNKDNQADTGRIEFYDGAGTAVSLPIQGQMRSFLDYSLPAGGAYDVQTDGTGTLQTGAVRLTSNRSAASRLDGTEVFDLLGRFVSVASAPIRSTHQVYVSLSSSEKTGMAIYNPDAAAVTVALTLVDNQGIQKTTGTLTLQGHQQLARFVDEAELFQTYFAAHPGNFTGTLNIQAATGRQVAVTGLIQKAGTGALIAIGTSPRVFIPGGSASAEPGASPATVLIFPQYVTGLLNSVPNRTRIVLENNASQAETGHIHFQDSNGNPNNVSVNGHSGADVQFSLPAWGTMEIETAGTEALQSGSVQVISDQGAASGLEGTEVFEVLGNYVSVDSAPSRSSHRVYASFDSAENTGIAVYNPESELITLDLSLIDGQGQERATAVLTLETNRQLARFVNQPEMFKSYFDAHPGAFHGTMAVRVRAGKSVALIGLIQKANTGALIAIAPASGDE